MQHSAPESVPYSDLPPTAPEWLLQMCGMIFPGNNRLLLATEESSMPNTMEQHCANLLVLTYQGIAEMISWN
jgi:hypothetical protein